ncbi:aminodeoxychorismate synthase component I [Spirillospora albida]|uniref:aminodeoxychorismate synthase component I n=1 Tax=Spirillospora albida TaxID=58123 RepID=UPI0004C2207B|nr:aminodeoxychorismate synthase component I [Spirillospora albida]
MAAAPRTLIVDNHDSFTHNLAHYVAEVTGTEPVVVRNDEPGWRLRHVRAFGNVIISPGPGTPERDADFGVCADIVRHSGLPILGVCLGHQGLAHVHGGKVGPAAEPRHGRVSPVTHGRTGLFAGLPSPFDAVRYHSLTVEELPDVLEATAWAPEGVLMGLRHRYLPQWGVQFHPESIRTEHGHRLIGNFLRLARPHEAPGRVVIDLARARPRRNAPRPLRVHVRRLPAVHDPETVFGALYGDGDTAFWLDSSKADDATGRFSIMGDASGPRARVAYADVRRGTVTVDGAVHTSPFLDWLDADIRAHPVEAPDLPFGFALGWVGYLGYELKAECGGDAAHASPDPDAAMVFADRAVVYDHRDGELYLLALDTDWFDHVRERLDAAEPPGPVPAAAPAVPRLRHGRRRYLDMIGACQSAISAGETYEVCLTNMLEADADLDPWPAYRALRAANPAPFAAYLRFGGLSVLSTSPERFLRVDAAGYAESRPIKGTRPRGATPAEDARHRAGLRGSEKDRAENLMIVDLVRNDLARGAVPGTVEVDGLFAIESYATVHQMVSTVRARLRPEVSAVDCVRAAFPGGSVTGAPKLRTMRIIDGLEAGPRGVYCGAIGYFSLTGAADLSIAIRTLAARGGRVRYGVGGAITRLSDPAAEFEETAVKAAPLLGLLGAAFPERGGGGRCGLPSDRGESPPCARTSRTATGS